MAPARVLKAVARRAFEASGLEGRVRLAFTECLGPCSEANVVFIYVHGRPLWLRRMNAADLFGSLFRHVADAIAGGRPALPPPLDARSFAWTGGGMGPEPPVEPGGSTLG